MEHERSCIYVKGKIQVLTHKVESTKAVHEVGTSHSKEEVSVMVMD